MMKNRFVITVSAAALSLSLIGGAVFAQDELGLRQMQDAVTTSLSQLNVDTSMVESLTLDELTQIQAVASTSGNDKVKTDRIGVILADAEKRIAGGGSVIPRAADGDVSADDLDADMVLKANLQKNLNQAGVTKAVDPESLTTEQLTQIELISSGTESNNVKRMEIEKVLAAD
jgi:hypothetical protein